MLGETKVAAAQSGGFSRRIRRPSCSSTLPVNDTKHPGSTSYLNLLLEDLSAGLRRGIPGSCSHRRTAASRGCFPFSGLLGPREVPPPRGPAPRRSGASRRRPGPGPALAPYSRPLAVGPLEPPAPRRVQPTPRSQEATWQLLQRPRTCPWWCTDLGTFAW